MYRTEIFAIVIGILIAAGIIGVLGCFTIEAPWCKTFIASKIENLAEERNIPPPEPEVIPPKQLEIDGKITEISDESETIQVRDKNDKEFSVEFSQDTKYLNEDNKNADLGYFRKGFIVRMEGRFIRDSLFSASKIKALQIPAISVFSPEPNEAVGHPLTVKGEARIEESFNFRIKDSDGKILSEGFDKIEGRSDKFNSFETKINYLPPSGGDGALEVFVYSGDGAETDKVTIPVKFKESTGKKNEIFFETSNSWQDLYHYAGQLQVFFR